MATQALAPREQRRQPRPADDELDQEAVFDVLLQQHGRLRALMAALDTTAVASLRSKSRPGAALRAGIEDLVQALVDHMQGEERALTTLLPRTRASGRELAHLRDEHARQRAELEVMRRRAATSDDVISLALAARAFVSDVLCDMDLEERRYLSPGARTSDLT